MKNKALKFFLKQYRIPFIGGAKSILAQVTLYVSAINFLLITVTAYATTLRPYLLVRFPWMTYPIFLGILIFLLLVAMVLEYKFMAASLYSWVSKQMFGHESMVMDRLNEILKELRSENRNNSPNKDIK